MWGKILQSSMFATIKRWRRFNHELIYVISIFKHIYLGIFTCEVYVIFYSSKNIFH